MLETGDNIYPSFTAQLADLRCFSVYQEHMAQAPYFFALGNHDLLSGVGSYLDAFYLPPTRSRSRIISGPARAQSTTTPSIKAICT